MTSYSADMLILIKSCVKEGTYKNNNINDYSEIIVSSDRSSCSDDGLLYIYPWRQLFQIFTQSIDAIDVTSVTLRRLNSLNAIDVIRYLGHI